MMKTSPDAVVYSYFEEKTEGSYPHFCG